MRGQLKKKKYRQFFANQYHPPSLSGKKGTLFNTLITLTPDSHTYLLSLLLGGPEVSQQDASHDGCAHILPQSF